CVVHGMLDDLPDEGVELALARVLLCVCLGRVQQLHRKNCGSDDLENHLNAGCQESLRLQPLPPVLGYRRVIAPGRAAASFSEDERPEILGEQEIERDEQAAIARINSLAGLEGSLELIRSPYVVSCREAQDLRI